MGEILKSACTLVQINSVKDPSKDKRTAIDGAKHAAQMMAIANHLQHTLLTLHLPAYVTRAFASTMVLEVGSTSSAKSLAYFLYWNLLPPGTTRRHIERSDLDKFLPDDKAALAFEVQAHVLLGNAHVSVPLSLVLVQ